jgi:hypothetical protein
VSLFSGARFATAVITTRKNLRELKIFTARM